MRSRTLWRWSIFEKCRAVRIETFLINLEGSDERLARATAQLAAAGLEFRRIAAFDGRRLKPEDLPLYDAMRAEKVFGRRLTGGEVGCFLSHLEGARQFLATGADYGLVVEDDLTVPASAGQVLDELLVALDGRLAKTPWWVANLGEPARRMFTTLGPVTGSHRLVQAHYFPVTTTALLWNRSGAEAFLRDARDIVMPVDHWLRRWVTAQGAGLALNPALFPASGAASEIDAAGPRKKTRLSLRYFVAKQRRLWTNKLKAWWHRYRY